VRPVLVPLDPTGGVVAELGPTLTRGLTLIALRALGTSDDAQEAVQEILARAMEAVRAGRVPADVPLAAFVHGIARHVLADIARSRRKEGQHLDTALTPLAASQPSPLECLIRQEECDQVNWALGRLSTEERSLLTHCFVDGETIQSIASRSGFSAERLRKRKSRALKRLKALLADRFGHDAGSAPTSVT